MNPLEKQNRARRTGSKRVAKASNSNGKRFKIILCCSHRFGLQLLMAFAFNPILQALFEVVLVRTDGSDKDLIDRPAYGIDSESTEVLQMVPKFVAKCISEGRFSENLRVIDDRYSDGAFLENIAETEADGFASGTHHGIFGPSVLEKLLGFNFHPAIWTEDLGDYIPDECRGKNGATTVIEMVKSGKVVGAAVGLHQLLPKPFIDGGKVFAWSECVPFNTNVISGLLADEVQEQMRRERMSNFQERVSYEVRSLAIKALPYLFGVVDARPDGVETRRSIEKV